MRVLLLAALCLAAGAHKSVLIFEDDSDAEGDPEETSPTTSSHAARTATSSTTSATATATAAPWCPTTAPRTTARFFHTYVATERPANAINDTFDPNDAPKRLLVYDDQQRFPTVTQIRSDSFNGKNVVLLPPESFIGYSYSRLRITKDYMQTALDAFGIILMGTVQDVLAMPPQYVLKSARTISMMKISREKLQAVWAVVKQNRHPASIPYETMERFRPLFKHVPAHDMADMNLNDTRILNYLGTHPDIDRHQAGLIASRFIQLNPDWETARVLNQMNNLICGLPIITMRHVKLDIYLQLSEQLFYHINACDKLQKKFFLGMMSQTQVLGKAHSWGARDIMRLGLLLPELPGHQLTSINPRAMIGITAKVMMEMRPESLQRLSEAQARQLGARAHNLFQLKMQRFREGLTLGAARARRPALAATLLLLFTHSA